MVNTLLVDEGKVGQNLVKWDIFGGKVGHCPSLTRGIATNNCKVGQLPG